MENERTPEAIREGIRTGILASIRRDVELRGGRTARLLVAAGLAGVVGAVGATLLVATHPFGHHPPWHVVLCSAGWAGLLVVTFSIAFLEIRTPSLSLARSASVGLAGLGLAGICGALCPDYHFLHWWIRTAVGGSVMESGGLPASALCFGLATAFVVGLVPAVLLLGIGRDLPVAPIVPAAILVALLAPGVALQSYGTSLSVFGGWLAGTVAGAYAGVAGGSNLRGWIESRHRG